MALLEPVDPDHQVRYRDLVRIGPGAKEAMRVAAATDYRSIANVVEILIQDFCCRNYIPLDVPTSKADANKR